jgi:hypothetical protein
MFDWTHSADGRPSGSSLQVGEEGDWTSFPRYVGEEVDWTSFFPDMLARRVDE